MPEYFNNIRHDVVDLIPPGDYRSALEVGGGEFGSILKIRDLFGPSAWGVDIRRTDAPLDHFLHGSIMDAEIQAQLPDASFDIIVANDVLEHLVDTEGFLSVCRSKLSEGGILALSVPNARQIRLLYHVTIRGTFPRTDAGLFDRTHLRWFCKRDVESALASAGFEVIEAKSVGRLIPRALSRLAVAELLALQNIFLARAA